MVQIGSAFKAKKYPFLLLMAGMDKAERDAIVENLKQQWNLSNGTSVRRYFYVRSDSHRLPLSNGRIQAACEIFGITEEYFKSLINLPTNTNKDETTMVLSESAA